MPKLNFDGYLIPEFLLPPKSNQRCMLHYIQRLHSGCPAQKNKCFALLASPERCWRLGPVATKPCCRQPGPRQLIVKSFQISFLGTAQPACPYDRAALKVLQPGISSPRSTQVPSGDRYSRNRYPHSWCEGKFGPKSRSTLAPHPQSC